MASSFLKKKAQERREIIDKTWGADAYNGANQRKEEEQKTSGGSNAAGGNLPVEESTSGKASSYLREKAQKRREVTRQNTPTTSRNNEQGHKSLKENEEGARAQIAQNAERRKAEGQGDLFAQVGGTVDYHLGNIKDFLFGNEYANETKRINEEAKRLYGALAAADAPLSLKGDGGRSVIDSLSSSRKALDDLERKLVQTEEAYKRSPNDALAAEYDRLAVQYNQAVAEHNKMYAEYEPQLTAYNDALGAYNSYVTQYGDRISVPMEDEYSPYREQLDALESEITRLGKRKAEIHNALSGLSRAAQYGGAVNLEGKRKEYADEIAAIDAQLLPLEARRNELVKEGGYLSDDDILGGLAYGGERFLAGALGMGENITDFIGTNLYGLLEGVTSLGGYAPNPVSKWAGNAYDSFAGNSITADYEESIRQRYKPTPKDEELTGFMQTVEQVALPIAAGYGIGKLAGMGSGAATGSLAAPNTATIAANATKGVFGANAAGGATREAHAAGASHAESLTYGWLIGAMEMSVEELSGAIPGLPDGSKVANVVKKVFSDPRVHAVVSHPAVQRLLGGVGEGAEEALSAIFTPYIQRATYDPNAPLATAEEIGEQALLGGLASLCIGAGIDIPTYVAESIYARNRLAVDEFDAETIQGILDTGLESPTDTNSYKLAAELKQKLDAGNDLMASEVMDLYRENVKQVNAENAEQGADEAIMDAAREAVGAVTEAYDNYQPAQEEDAVEAPRNEAQATPFNFPTRMSAEERVAAVAAQERGKTSAIDRLGYGEHGTEAFTDIAEKSGQDLDLVRLAFQSAYEMGTTDTSVDESRMNSVQLAAYKAGQLDRLKNIQRANLKARETYIWDDGLDTNSIPAEVGLSQREIDDARYLFRALGVKGGFGKTGGNASITDKGVVTIAADFGISDEKLKALGNMSHLAKVKKLAKERGRSFISVLAHELTVHRVMQLAPTEFRSFMDAMYRNAGKDLPAAFGTLAQQKQEKYGEQGVSLTTDKAIEEIVADLIVGKNGLYKTDAEFMAAVRKAIEGAKTAEEAAKVEKGARTWLESIKAFLRRLGERIGLLKGAQKAQAQQVYNEVSELKNLFETALKAATDRVTAEREAGNAEHGDGLSESSAFSLKNPVEQSGKLIALHNIRAIDLKDAIRLGGFIAPSIAVIKTNYKHFEFGENSVVFPRLVIDPAVDARHKLYGADGYTPTVARSATRIQEYDSKKIQKIKSNIYQLVARGIEKAGLEQRRIYTDFLENIEFTSEPQTIANLLATTAEVTWAYMEAHNMPIPTRTYTNGDGQYTRPEHRVPMLQENIGLSNVEQWVLDMLQDAAIGDPITDSSPEQILEDMFTNQQLRAVSPLVARTYNSIDQARDNAWRLDENADDSDARASTAYTKRLKEALFNRMFNKTDKAILNGEIPINRHKGEIPARLSAAEDVYDEGIRGAEAIRSALAERGEKVSAKDAQKIADLFEEADNRLVNYFEAKPGRLVALNEASAIVVPNNIDADLLQMLKDAGCNVLMYENAQDRIAKVNSVQDAQFSLKDSDYMKAVNSGDMETAQRMVDEAAKAAGYTPVSRYHQTAGGFTKFSTANPRAGLNDSQTPNGIFFKDNDHDIGLEGKTQLRAYLKANNMLHFSNREDANRWYRKNVAGYASLQDELNAAIKPFLDALDEIEKKQFAPATTEDEFYALSEKEETIIEEMREVEDSYRGQLRELLNAHFLSGKSGYDGIELDYDGHRWVNGKREDVHTYIVFDASQAKSADPVTYDDNGNVIPLSERFNSDSDDIRYSMKDSDPTKMEQDLNALRQQRTELQDEIDGAYLDDLPQADINRLENRMYKLEAEIDKLVAQERRAAVKTSMKDILTNLSAYRRSDLESLAEQVSNGNWEGYEDLSRAELEDALREEIEGRELNALEMQSAKHGLYVRPVSKGQQGQKVVSLFGNEGATFEEDGVQHSLKSLQHDITEGKMFDDLVSAGVFTKKEAGLLKTNLDRLIKYMMPNASILDMNEDYDRDNRPFGAYKPNSDPLYKISLDFSTLCRKRLMTQYVIEQLQLRENRPMSAEEQIAIRSMLLDYAQQEKALQVACAMCYVEAARLKAPKQIEAFFNNTESILRKHFAKKDHVFNAKVIEAQKKFKRDHGYDEDAPKKDMKQKDRTAFDKMSAAMRKGYVPNAEQQAVIDTAVKLPRSTFLTAANLTALSIDHPEIYDAYTSHIRASTRSKGLEGDIPYYYGDSQGAVSDSFIDGVNAENGMRFDSWSDFQMKHMLDMITAVVDLSVRGSKMHGYTKFPEMVRIFGNTGMMFNLSGVTEGTGFDENGNLIFSSTEGIDYAEAIKLRKAFPETAGLQCIGVSDAHIRALLRSKDVDYVIPYHTSGMNATLRKMAGIHDWSNYEKTQHTRPDPKAKKPANAEKWHVEPVWSEFFVNEGKDGYEVMENTAKRYVEMCRERGLIPKFDQFLDEPGYWKLLIDRKMVNQITGEIIEQQPVKPIFDFDLIEAEIDREVSNYDPDLEKKALKYVVDNFDAVNQRIKDLKKRHPKKSMMTMGNEILQAYAEGVKKGAGVQHSLKDDGDLVAENEKLREVNRALREQFKVTKLAKVDKKSLEKFSKQLLKDWQSRADITETRDALEELYTFIRTEMEKDEPDMAAMEQKAYEVAEGILTQSVEVDDQMYQDYKELRSRLRTTGVSIDPSYGSSLMGYEDLQDFRKRNMGRIKLRKDGLPVDVLYQELASTYPDLFNEAEHSNPADQLVHIAEVLEEMRPIEVNPYKHEMREAATWLATDIMHRIYELPQAKPTFADKAAAKLSEQKAKDKQKLYDAVTGERMAAGREMAAQKRMGQQKLAELREKKNERISQLIARQRDKLNVAKAEAFVKREQAVKQVKDRYKAKEARMSENRKASILRAQIVRHADQMSRKLLKGTDRSHIPEGLRGAVAELLSCINLESNRTYDPVTGSYKKSDDGLPTRRTEEFRKVKEQYEAISANNEIGMVIDPNLLGVPTEGIKSMLDQVIAMQDIRLVDMTLDQLQIVYNVLRTVEHSIVMAGKTFTRMRWSDIHEMADSFMEDTATRKTKRARTERHYTLDIETPYTFFFHMGEAGHAFYRMLRNAQDSEQVMQDELVERVQETVSLEARQKAEKETVEFTTQRGDKLTLSKAHIMEIYLLNNRPQARRHLLGGGIVQPKVGKIRKGTDAVLLTEMDVAEIIGSLTDEERKIADGLQKITLRLAEWGNEASMTVYGYKKFNDPTYWTIRSSAIGINQTVEQGQNKPRSIGNMGSAKNVIPEASNTLDIAGVFDTFDQHAADMLCYSAWLAPMEDANRLFNYKYRDESWNPTGKTMKGIIDRVAGDGGTKYWLRLMEDIQNGLSAPVDTATEGIVMNAIGMTKRAAIAANLRVVIQQPTAFGRAAAVLDPDVMIAALGKGVAVKPFIDGWNKAVKYAPIAARKAAGGFEVASNPKQLADLMYQPVTKLGKATAAARESGLWLAGKADQVTWGTIWNACELQVKRNNKDLKADSDEFYDAVKELFTEVIDQTQVVDGVLQRSQAMRSGSAFVKQMTAFTGEPTMSANMVVRAYDQARYETDPKKRSKAIKKLGRVLGAYGMTAVLNAFAQSLVDALRDDDDEKDYWEKVWKHFVGISGDEGIWWDYVRNVVLAGNISNNINPLTWLPVWKDVFSVIQGYSVARMDAASFEDFFDATANTIKSVSGKGKLTPGNAALRMLLLAGKLGGSGGYNMLRDIEGAVRTFQVETDSFRAIYDTEKLLTQPANNKSKYMDILFNAYQNDGGAYEYILSDMLKGDYFKGDKQTTKEYIMSAMDDRLMEEQGVKMVSELDQRFLFPDQQKGYDSRMAALEKSGLWDDANKKQRNGVKADLYGIVTESKGSEDMREKIAKGKPYDLDETEYLLYQLALEMHDKPNDKGKLGTYTSAEKAEALLAADLGDDEMAFLWDSKKGYEALDDGISMEHYIRFAAGVASLEPGVDYKKGNSASRKAAVRAVLRDMGLTPGSREYKWLWDTEY